uniref:Uncharacterized protein n=1 Tax=Rhizophora mucronata TaxID=61149 RepID=A0A2P2NSG4_RHIMU
MDGMTRVYSNGLQLQNFHKTNTGFLPLTFKVLSQS